MRRTAIIFTALALCHGLWALEPDYGDYHYPGEPVSIRGLINEADEPTPWPEEIDEYSLPVSYSTPGPNEDEYNYITHEISSAIDKNVRTTNPPQISAIGKNRKNEIKIQQKSSPGRNEAIEKTLQLLEEGTQQMSPNIPDDIILVLGNTGAGKSTITLFITGNNSELIAYEKDPVTILIKDDRNKISTSTIISKTIFPELYLDHETQMAFYDCPGFSDTRNTSIEIVNSFFIRKVADHAKRIKILLVVNHNSLKPGGDRKDFMLVVKHTTDFLRNIENFNDSIALVASKCESSRSDRRILMGMAQFIEEAKSQLHTIMSGDDLVSATKLIDILLQQNKRGEYTRLTFFQQPDELGPLSEMESIQERKVHIKDTIYNNIHYTETSPMDFGLSISPQAKNDVRNLTDAINKQIIGHFENIKESLEERYKELLQENLNSTNQAQTLGEIKAELQSFFRNVISFRTFSILNDTSLSAATFLKKMANVSWTYPNNMDQQFSNGIIHNGEYFDFLQSLTNTNSDSISNQIQRWIAPIPKLISNVNLLTVDFSHQQNEQMLGFLGEVDDLLVNYYTKQFREIKAQNSTEFKATVDRLQSFLRSWTDYNLNEDVAKQTTTLTELVEDILLTVHQLTNSPTESLLNDSLKIKMRTTADFLNFVTSNELNVLSKHSHAIINPSKWLQTFKTFLPRAQTVFKVGNILNTKLGRSITQLASAMQTYYVTTFDNNENNNDSSNHTNLRDQIENDLLHFQSTIDQFEVALPNEENGTSIRIKTQLISNLTLDLTAPLANFDPLLPILEDIVSECELLDTNNEPQPIEAWLSPLKSFVKSLEETLKPTSCNFKNIDGQITAIVQGTFISLKDVTNNCLPNSQGIQKVLITSLHTIYLDTDLNGLQFNPQSNLNLAIVSPNWVVSTTNNRSTIKLNGNSGPDREVEKYRGVAAFTADGGGLDGMPGVAGGNAGNFLGVGGSVTGGQVSVYTTGGRGGRGQDGGDGRPGFDAENVDRSKITYSTEFIPGSNFVQVKFITYDPYKYEERGFNCTSELNKDKQTDSTFYLFGLIPTGTTRTVQKETVTVFRCRQYEFYDPRGSPGSPGGNGGAGGLGGKGGVSTMEFTLNSSNYSQHFSLFQKDGDDGLSGQGGNGGTGGKRGGKALLQIHPASGNSNGFANGIKIIDEDNNQGWAPNGPQGREGVNVNGVDRVEPASVIYSTEKTRVWSLDTFVEFADSNLKNPYVSRTLVNFLEQLSPTNDEVKRTEDEVERTEDEVERTEDEVERTEDEVERTEDEVERTEDEVELNEDEVELNEDEVELNEDEVELNEDEVEPSNDEVEPNNDEVDPNNDEVEPNNDEVEPNNDEVEPNNDEMVPNNDEVDPNNDEVEPNNDEVEPNNDEVDPNNNELEPDPSDDEIETYNDEE